MASQGKRRALAILLVVLLLAAGAVYTAPRMKLSGPAGYTAEGVAAFNADCQTGEPCLLGSVSIRWSNRGPLEWALPYTIERITVCDGDGHPLAEQPDSLVYDLAATNVWPGAGIYEDRQALLAEYARQKKACTLVKGLRAVSDYENELQMALINRKLNPRLETMFLPSSAKYTYISSSVVKEMARYGADLSDFVPREIIQDVLQKIDGGRDL